MTALLDPAIRAALVEHIRATCPSATVLHEVPLRWHSVRADVVAVGADLHGFEIKSDGDSFARLRRQIKGYDGVFDFSSIVVGARHVAKAREVLPVSWGVLVAEPTGHGVSLRRERVAERNEVFDPRALAGQLWRPDLVDLRRTLGIATDRRAPVGDLWEHACGLPLDVLRKAVRESTAAHKEVFDEGREERRDLRRTRAEERAAHRAALEQLAAREETSS